MSHLIEIGHEYLDGLGLSSAAHAGVLLREPALCDVLLHFVRALSGVELSGILISRATVPLASTEVLEVSPVILSELGYTSLSEYQAALSAPGFVHVDDAEIVDAHIRHALSAPYDVRLLKAGGGYLKWRVYGVTIHDPTDATRTLRISLLLR